MRSNLLAIVAVALSAFRTEPALAVTFTNDTQVAAGNATYDGQDIVVQGCTLTVNGTHAFNSLLLSNTAVLTHSPAPNGEPANQLLLTIAQNCTVALGSRIDVRGGGFATATGPGAGGSSTTWGGSGGGHGGLGGVGSGSAAGGVVNDVLLTPTQPGSGGGDGYGGYGAGGGRGGGVVRLTIGGTLRLDGSVLADGGNGLPYTFGGGGAGGSVSLTAGVLAGNGSVSANGGSGVGDEGGGGGGGCVAIRYNSATAFGGALTAYGGAGAQYGGAGTVFTKAASQSAGELRLDNNGHAGQLTPLTSPTPFDLTIANYAGTYPQSALTNGNVTIKSNGLLTHLSGQTGFDLTALNNFVIEAGGKLDLGGKGHGAVSGPGAGQTSVVIGGGGGGGGHGGTGGNDDGAGGGCYDSVVAPVQLGSGGGDGFLSPGGSGGGLVRLKVLGALQVDGILGADGVAGIGSGYSGGGAGGSLYLTVGTLSGRGAITANGGASTRGGGGGGGRVAVLYGTNNFIGTLAAYGGAGVARGGAGTIFTQASAAPIGLTLIHNGGNSGGVTRLNTAFWPANGYFDLTVAGAARLVPDMPMTFSNLVVTSGGMVTHDLGQAGFHLVALGDTHIDAGASINADGLGQSSASGPGAGGSSATWGGGGGGYGGAGGAGTNGAPGGGTYGVAAQPVDLGSGGGLGYESTGGNGGGAIRLTVGEILYIDGAVTANGVPGADYIYGGGGSGGSIYLNAKILTGAGTVSANGGPSVAGGGGGGGRVVMYSGLLVGLANPPTALGGLSGSGSKTNLNGQAGVVFNSTNIPPFQVTGVSPAGALLQPITNIEVRFGTAVDPSTFTAADVVITTPAGTIPAGQVTVTPASASVINVGFPVQSATGQYRIQLGPRIEDIFHQELDQNGNGIPGEVPNDVYSATFSISNSVSLSGTIRLTNGTPVAGVLLQAGATTTTTAANGTYALYLPLGWSGTVTPQIAGCTFTPASRTYANLVASAASQDFTETIGFRPILTVTRVSGRVVVGWTSVVGVQYQIQTSDNLLIWANAGPLLTGNGSSLSWSFEAASNRQKFFRVVANN